MHTFAALVNAESELGGDVHGSNSGEGCWGRLTLWACDSRSENTAGCAGATGMGQVITPHRDPSRWQPEPWATRSTYRAAVCARLVLGVGWEAVKAAEANRRPGD